MRGLVTLGLIVTSTSQVGAFLSSTFLGLPTSASPPRNQPSALKAARPSFGMFSKILDAMTKGPVSVPTGFTDPSPSWEEIGTLLSSLQTPVS